MKKILFFLMAFFAIAIGLYPVMYFVIDRTFGLLSTKSEMLLGSVYWNSAFYVHIIFGGIALLIGWVQFRETLRIAKPQIHRILGTLYVIMALLSSLGGFVIGWSATGGAVSSVGFILLSIVWFTTTFRAYIDIRARRIRAHQTLMTYSYAACFAAVTLRLWLPLLTGITGNFTTAYQIVAWLCWVPNIAVAYLLTTRHGAHNAQ